MKSILSFVESRKFYVALIGLVLQLIPVLIVPTPSWYALVVAAATAVGVYAVPNESKQV